MVSTFLREKKTAIGKNVKYETNMIDMKVRLLSRRGASFCVLGDYTAALFDYQKALSLMNSKNNLQPKTQGKVLPKSFHEEKDKLRKEHLAEDISKIEHLLKVTDKKMKGDVLFCSGNLQDAVEVYTEALRLEPGFLSIVANRAAVYLALKDYMSSIVDSTTALHLLRRGRSKSQGIFFDGSTCNSVAAMYPCFGSPKWTAWCVRLYVRRGLAYCKLGDNLKGTLDYQRAMKLQPKNKEVACELEVIRSCIMLHSTNNLDHQHTGH